MVEPKTKIENKYPPNYSQIRQWLNPTREAVFAYDDVIYNPSGKTIPEDTEYHETIHFRQQKNFGSVESWWTRYLVDRTFRLEQEVEAYSYQYNFLRKHLPEKATREALEEFAAILSSEMYDIMKTKQQCRTLINKYAIKLRK